MNSQNRFVFAANPQGIVTTNVVTTADDLTPTGLEPSDAFDSNNIGPDDTAPP